jgi:hypothetical protein
LDEHSSEDKATYEAQKKLAEDDFRPFFMKLYATETPEKAPTNETFTPESSAGPKVEEVD